MSAARRWGTAVALVGLGALVGLSLVGVHQRWLLLGLGVAASVAVLAALPRAVWARPPYAVGLAAVVGIAATPRGEGDYLIGADVQGYVVLGLTVALLVASVVTLGSRES